MFADDQCNPSVSDMENQDHEQIVIIIKTPRSRAARNKMIRKKKNI